MEPISLVRRCVTAAAIVLVFTACSTEAAVSSAASSTAPSTAGPYSDRGAPLTPPAELGAASGSSPPASRAERGELVSVTPVAELEAAAVAAQLRAVGLDASRVRNGVRAFRIVYETTAPDGTPIEASGLVALPAVAAPEPLRVVSWQHGTLGYRAQAASVAADSEDRAAAFVFAGAGYAVSAPDYLGLGAGPGTHPYDDTASAVSASVDALRALRRVPDLAGRAVDGRVLISGFSQGGPVTMALGRALQEGADPELTVGGLAPIAGPYDFSGSVAAAASGGIAHATAYLAYLTVAWNRLHHLYDDPSDAFHPPYDRTIDALFDGSHPSSEIFAGLPETLPELFTPQFLDRLRNPAGALKAALDEADTSCAWAPQVPVRIYHAAGDLDVPRDNAEFCRSAVAERGAVADVVELGGIDHGASVVAALPMVLAQFDA